MPHWAMQTGSHQVKTTKQVWAGCSRKENKNGNSILSSSFFMVMWRSPRSICIRVCKTIQFLCVIESPGVVGVVPNNTQRRTTAGDGLAVLPQQKHDCLKAERERLPQPFLYLRGPQLNSWGLWGGGRSRRNSLLISENKNGWGIILLQIAKIK